MLPKLTADDTTRLWSNIIRRGEDDCWPWVLSVNPEGYGRIKIQGGVYQTHRLAYFACTGYDPGDLQVRHECDNPPCCNPKLLIAGTPADNGQDIAVRGRGRKTQFDQILARSYTDQGIPKSLIAQALGCSVPTVGYLVDGRKREPSTPVVMCGRHVTLPVLTFYEIAKFWGNVIRRGEDDCWPCVRVYKKTGYGIATVGERLYRASRVAYLIHYGKDPGELVVRHKCDYPPCCNPKHLLLGTAEDNARDREARGRSKGTQFDKLLAQSYREQGLTLQQIGDTMGTTPTTISDLLNGKYDRED